MLKDEINQEDSCRREELTQIRNENRREATRAIAIDTAQEVRRIARQRGMLAVDATNDSILHSKGIDRSELNNEREVVRVVLKDLALETMVELDSGVAGYASLRRHDRCARTGGGMEEDVRNYQVPQEGERCEWRKPEWNLYG